MDEPHYVDMGKIWVQDMGEMHTTLTPALTVKSSWLHFGGMRTADSERLLTSACSSIPNLLTTGDCCMLIS